MSVAMVVALVFAGWCALAVVVALKVGPVLRKLSELRERMDAAADDAAIRAEVAALMDRAARR